MFSGTNLPRGLRAIGSAVVLAGALIASPSAFGESLYASASINIIHQFDGPVNSGVFALGDGMNNPYGIAVDSTGNVYVASTQNGQVLKFTASRTYTVYASGLLYPSSLAFDAAGNLFVGDYYGIRKFTAPETSTVFASSISQPYGLAFDGLGNLYESGTDGVIRRFTAPETSTVFASGLSSLFGLAFNGAGELFAAEYDNGVIRRFTEPSVSSNSVVYASGLNTPSGLAFNSDGHLFVATFQDGTVKEFTAPDTATDYRTGLFGPVGLAFAPVPEPATWALLASGLGLLAGGRSFRRQGRSR